MWGIARLAPLVDLAQSLRLSAAIACAVVGVTVDVAGIVSFRHAGTTVKPMHPEKTTALVCSGIFGFTRNPMYLASVIFLVAWAAYLSSAWALPGAVAFVLYMNRFQIAPEEKVLALLFGSSYAEYRSNVRRWI